MLVLSSVRMRGTSNTDFLTKLKILISSFVPCTQSFFQILWNFDAIMYCRWWYIQSQLNNFALQNIIPKLFCNLETQFVCRLLNLSPLFLKTLPQLFPFSTASFFHSFPPLPYEFMKFANRSIDQWRGRCNRSTYFILCFHLFPWSAPLSALLNSDHLELNSEQQGFFQQHTVKLQTMLS